MNNPTFLPRTTVQVPGAGQTALVGPLNFRFGAGAPAPAAGAPSYPFVSMANAPFNWLTLSPLQSQSDAHRV